MLETMILLTSVPIVLAGLDFILWGTNVQSRLFGMLIVFHVCLVLLYRYSMDRKSKEGD